MEHEVQGEQQAGIFVRQQHFLIDADRRSCEKMNEERWAHTEQAHVLLQEGTVLEVSNGLGVGDVNIVSADNGASSAASLSITVGKAAKCRGFYPEIAVGLFGVWSYCGVFKDATDVTGNCNGQRTGERSGKWGKTIWQFIAEKFNSDQFTASNSTAHFFAALQVENRDSAACADSTIQLFIPPSELPAGWQAAVYHGETISSSDSRQLNFGFAIPANATGAGATAAASGHAQDADGVERYWYDFCIGKYRPRSTTERCI